MPRLKKYHDQMTTDDTTALLAECDALDAAYRGAADADAAQAAIDADHAEEVAAAEEQSLLFQRFIAGDR